MAGWYGGRPGSIAVVGTQDRTNLAFAALQLNEDRGFNELVYGIVSRPPPPKSLIARTVGAWFSMPTPRRAGTGAYDDFFHFLKAL